MKTLPENKDITKTFDPGDMRKWRHKWQSNEEFNDVKNVLQRHNAMRDHKEKSCYWSDADGGIDTLRFANNGGSSTGSSWTKHWNLMWKAFLMWSLPHPEGRSNLKSPTSFAPIQAALAEYSSNPLISHIDWEDESDKQNIRVINQDIKNWETSADIAKAKLRSLFECLVTGTAVTWNPYICDETEVDYFLTGKERMEEIAKAYKTNDQEKVQKIIEQTEKDMKPMTKKGTKVNYRGPAFIPVSNYEIFWDDGAHCIKGLSHPAMDLDWRYTLSLDQFREIFLNSKDPYVDKKAVDRVVPARDAASSYGTKNQFFVSPEDIPNGSDAVVIHQYYHKGNDMFVMVANDIRFRKGYLPYNHKELPFSRHTWIDIPDQMYGMGMVAAVESLQSEDEVTRNMAIEATKDSLRRIYLTTSDDEDAVRNAAQGGYKEVAAVNNPQGVNLLQNNEINLNAYSTIQESIATDVVKATGVNPMAYSIPKPNEPVRNNMMSLESTLKILRMGYMNWGEGYRDSIEQIIEIKKQFAYDDYTEVEKDGKKIKKYSKLKLKGMKYDVMEKGSNKKGLIKSEDDSTMEVTPDIYELEGKALVSLEPFQPSSKALRMDAIQQAMTVTMPIIMNPALMKEPIVVELLREYYMEAGLPTKFTEMLQDEDSEEEIQDAKKQENLMMDGNMIAGIPGESEVHKAWHVHTLMHLKSEYIKYLENPVESSLSPEEQQAMPVLIKRLETHLIEDDAPKAGAEQLAVQKPTQPQMPQPQMPPNPMGAGQGMPEDMNQGVQDALINSLVSGGGGGNVDPTMQSQPIGQGLGV